MQILSEKGRIEYLRPDLFNDRIRELKKIDEIPIQVEGSENGFIVEFMELKKYEAIPTVSAKLKKANNEIRRLKKANEKLSEQIEELRKREEGRGKEKSVTYSYEFMLLSAINELGRILGGLPKEFVFLMKWKRYGDFAAARREYCEKAGINEEDLIPKNE